MVAAQGSEQKASVSEVNAKSSEQASKLSETNARKSEESAASSAATATGQASSARTSASNASVSEANAKASEKAASVSAANAKASASNAAISASNSASSASASEVSNQNSKKWAEYTESPDGAADTDSTTGKTQSSRSWALYSKAKAQESASSASTATAQANTATTQANNAKTSATNSANSASASATSASNAKTSETNAGSNATTSRNWAVSETSPDGATDTDSGTGKTQSSRTWALESKANAQSASSSASIATSQASSASTSAANASKSATSASSSATNAASSATSASDSASSAASSAASASDSKDKASEYKTSASGSATAAASSASSASTSATNAKAAMNTANTAASSASTSATSASTSASNASKSEVAAKSAQAEAERARDEANSAIAKLTGVMKYAGQVDNYSDLTNITKAKGDVWNVVNADTVNGIKAGDNVAWNGTDWDNLSGIVDLSAYAEKADYQKAITSATANGATITFNHKDGTTSTATVNNVASSTSATNDSNGANIANTYLKLDSFKSSLIASLPACYERSTMWSAAKNIITVPDYITVNIGNNGYVKTGASTIDVNTASNWDNSTYATSANRAGKDFYIYACQASGTVPKFVLSANSTVPTGYTATNSRKIGGFHCECADVGTINGHPLSGYIAGDILPRSIWDLKHRPVSSPEGMVWCDGVWVDIYLAGWDGSKLVSQYGAVIQDGDSTKKWHGELFNEEFHKIKKRLLWRDEFAAYAKGSNEKTNIAGSSDPNTTGGHKDTANRRMISNYGLEDCCGVLWQWTNDISMRGSTTNGTDSDYASSGKYWLNGYEWDSANRIGNSDIDGDKTKYGNEYGLLVRLIAGGNWYYGSSCGSRSVAGNRLSACRYGNCAGRGASEPWVG